MIAWGPSRDAAGVFRGRLPALFQQGPPGAGLDAQRIPPRAERVSIAGEREFARDAVRRRREFGETIVDTRALLAGATRQQVPQRQRIAAPRLGQDERERFRSRRWISRAEVEEREGGTVSRRRVLVARRARTPLAPRRAHRPLGDVRYAP